MTHKRSKEEWIRRYVSFIFILFIIAFGTSLSIRANLGSSPISAPPYVLSLIPGSTISMGGFTMCMHVFFILAQIIILRKDFEKRQYAQILVSFLFGVYTDLTMWMTGFLQIPFTLDPWVGYPLRVIELLIGGALLAFGIACEVRCDSLILAGEGFPLAIARRWKHDFGKVKMCSDTSLVSIGAVIMVVAFGHWDWKIIGGGTIISMFYVGFMVRVFAPKIKWLDKIFIPAADRASMKAGEQSEKISVHPIITIGREYGSGGKAIGKMVAERLGFAFYDEKIITETAEKLGFTVEEVAGKEQNLSTADLWNLIFTDKSIPPSMNHSANDAIFVNESRIIKKLAQEKPCVIIGRCANWILRDNPGIFRVFIGSEIHHASQMIMHYQHITETKARNKIKQINRGRANHYLQYTGRQWKSSKGYDLMINAGKLGIEKSVQLILEAVEDTIKSSSREQTVS